MDNEERIHAMLGTGTMRLCPLDSKPPLESDRPHIRGENGRDGISIIPVPCRVVLLDTRSSDVCKVLQFTENEQNGARTVRGMSVQGVAAHLDDISYP